MQDPRLVQAFDAGITKMYYDPIHKEIYRVGINAVSGDMFWIMVKTDVKIPPIWVETAITI